MRIKKTSETAPIQAQVVDSLSGNSTTDAPSVHAVNEGLKWKLLQQVTGTTHISLPASFNEILVVGETINYITYTINIPYNYLEQTQEKQYLAGYYSGTGDNGVYIVKAKLSELYLTTSKVGGNSQINATATTVYYR